MKNSIAYLAPGKNYLNPKIKLVVDESMSIELKEKLQSFLEKWIADLINTELSDLVNLNTLTTKNNYSRALCFQLFENGESSEILI